MITGKEVFKADTPLAVAYKQVHEAAAPPRSVDPAIPEKVETLILRCIEKEPERRFQTVGELEKALAGLGYERPTNPVLSRPSALASHHTTFIIARKKARLLMMAIQIMYLSIYSAALYHIEHVGVDPRKTFEVPPPQACLS